MPVVWTIDATRHVLRLRELEPVTFPEWQDAANALTRARLGDTPRNWLFDRRAAAAPEPSFARAVGAYLTRRAPEFRGSRIALLVDAPGGAAYGMARMQSMLNAESGAATEVFTSESEALAWLAQVPTRGSSQV